MAPRRVTDRSTRPDLPAVALVLWTWFVWGGRIRNALGDPELGGAGLIGTLALAGSFVTIATALAVLVLRDRRGATPGAARVVLTWTLALWTAGVWSVRVIDIAVLGGHEIAFVLVHVALAVVSIAMSVWAVGSLRRRGSSSPVSVG